MRIDIIRIWIFHQSFKFIFVRNKKNLMSQEKIHFRDFHILIIVGLFFCFCQFFFNVAFSFTRRLGNLSVFTKIFHDVIIINRIVNQWQDRTYCDRENNKYGNEKLQWLILSYKYTTEFCFKD